VEVMLLMLKSRLAFSSSAAIPLNVLEFKKSVFSAVQMDLLYVRDSDLKIKVGNNIFVS
jgi:hypothetical protein